MEYGDLVIGNEKARRYGITKTGTTWIYLGEVTSARDRDFHMANIYVVAPEDFPSFDKYRSSRGYTIEEARDYWGVSTIFPVRRDRFDVISPSGNKGRAHVLERLED